MMQNCGTADDQGWRDQPAEKCLNDELCIEEHTSVPYEPVKVKRYNPQNIVLQVLLVANLVVALTGCKSSMAKVEQDNYEVFVDWENIWLCTEEECLTDDISSTLCKQFVTNAMVFRMSVVGFTLPCLLALIFNTTMIFGNAFVPKNFMLFNMSLCLVTSVVATKASLDTVSSALCYQTTLQSLGFRHGPAVALFATNVATSSLCLIFSMFFLHIRRERPAL